MAEAVHHVDAVGPDALRWPSACTRLLTTPSWFRSRTYRPSARPMRARDVGVQPDLVLLHHLVEDRVRLRAAERVHRRPAEEQPERARRAAPPAA